MPLPVALLTDTSNLVHSSLPFQGNILFLSLPPVSQAGAHYPATPGLKNMASDNIARKLKLHSIISLTTQLQPSSLLQKLTVNHEDVEFLEAHSQLRQQQLREKIK
jgi:hypothetical protein